MPAQETGKISSGTLGGLDEFCGWVINKGLMRSAAMEPLRSATKQILATVEPDNPGIDLRTIDTDDVMSRFETLAGQKYAPDSLRAYRNRFNRAIELYRQYLDNGAANFKPPPGRAPRRRTSKPGSSNGSTGNTRPASTLSSASKAPAGAPSQTLIDYPFPLRTGGIAHLYLPPTLEKDDAERLAAYVRALVFEPQRQIQAGQTA
jgi:hypothetical protein